jgi:heme exporter protein CcmD
MIDLGPHTGFIVASYLVTTTVLAAIIWQSFRRYKATKRQLEAAQAADSNGANNA